MVITGIDDRNISLVLDIFQAKMLVEALRKVSYSREGWPFMIDASNKVNESGFNCLGTDVQTVLSQTALTLGFWTDKIVKLSKEDLEKLQENGDVKKEEPTEKQTETIN